MELEKWLVEKKISFDFAYLFVLHLAVQSHAG